MRGLFSVTRTRKKGEFSNFTPDLEEGQTKILASGLACSRRWLDGKIPKSFQIPSGFYLIETLPGAITYFVNGGQTTPLRTKQAKTLASDL